MGADLTRDTFDPARNYSRVLMQQGRVALDADWNEQASILLHYMRNLVADVFGPHAGPLLDCGFQLIAPLGINWKSAVNSALSNLLTLDEINKLIERMGSNNGDFLVLPGRYYVGGLPLTLTRPMLYSDQPGYSAFTGDSRLEALHGTDLPYLLYLDVWEQHITALEDDTIREVALGGPDTCTRAKVHWQIRAVIQPETLANDPATGQPQFSCNYVDTLQPLGSGKIRARARLDKPPTDLCAIPPESRYRGVENQLYRVEIHNSGIAAAWPAATQAKGQPKMGPAQADALVAGTATFKWSRENGSVVLSLASLNGGTAVMTFLGRDSKLSLEQGDLTEVMDDALAACGVSGPLAVVQTVDRDRMTVTLQFANAATAPSYSEDEANTLHPRLIRWDNKPGDMTGDGALPVLEPADDTNLETGWIDLEDGVQIRFATGGGYREGDYWLIPARTITGDVDWPHEPEPDADGNPIAMALGARGIHHFYAPLGLVTPGGTDRVQGGLADCRCVIQSLTCMTK